MTIRRSLSNQRIKLVDFNVFQALYDGLNDVNPQYWRDIIAIQKNWIGQCTGTTIDFVLKVMIQGMKKKCSVCEMAKNM